MPNISKNTILEKVKEYMSRAEAIQEELKNPKKEIIPTKFFEFFELFKLIYYSNEVNDDFTKVKESIKSLFTNYLLKFIKGQFYKKN